MKRPLVAVLAGGRGSRLGGSKALVELGGEPLIARVLLAAAAFETVVVAKRSTALPSLDVPVWIEPDEPSHPLCGVVAALERAGGAVVAVACDQPWVTPALIERLAARGPAVCSVDGVDEPFPGHYDQSQLDALRAALASQASLRGTLRQFAAERVEVPRELVASVNTREDLAAAERRLPPPQAVQPDARTAPPPVPPSPRRTARGPA